MFRSETIWNVRQSWISYANRQSNKTARAILVWRFQRQEWLWSKEQISRSYGGWGFPRIPENSLRLVHDGERDPCFVEHMVQHGEHYFVKTMLLIMENFLLANLSLPLNQERQWSVTDDKRVLINHLVCLSQPKKSVVRVTNQIRFAWALNNATQ